MNLTEFSKWIENHIFTPSELEDYLLCPFRFYAGSYLKVTPPPEQEPELTPAEIGRLLHRVLEKYFRERGDLLSIARAEFRRAVSSRPTLIPVLVEHQEKRIERMLTHFLELESHEESLTPAFFEWSFGDEKVPPLEISNIKLAGRIDRIDIDVVNKRFLVIDYKTGSKKITGGQILLGESLQLPLYILAVKQLLLPDFEPIGGLYYHLSDLSKENGLLHADRLPPSLEISPRSSSLIPAQKWELVFETTKNRMREIISEIRKENFASQSEPCERWCVYQDVCKIRSSQNPTQTVPFAK